MDARSFIGEASHDRGDIGGIRQPGCSQQTQNRADGVLIGNDPEEGSKAARERIHVR